ncbi:TPA: hypothetical protein U1215_002236 [Streptococcus suis]|nr:hypothetical protein [Streptococcus suis]
MVVPKFRAWDKMHNEWSNGFFIYSEGGLYTPNYGFNRKHLKKRTDVYPIAKQERFILMQSTGLFDKNGKEIFEGDVVKFNDIWSEYGYEGYVDGTSEGENFSEIIKTEDGFSFGRTKIPESSVFYFLNDEHMKFSEIVKSDDFSMVVIGNIYENPELVEGING